MSSYLTLALAGVALVAVTVAGVQSTRLASSHADLATVQSQLSDARRERDQATRDRQLATAALSAERDAALAAEMEASELKARIARDAGTSRDGETAPVLKETIQGLTSKPRAESDPIHGSHRRRLPVAFQDGPFLAGRPDDLFLGRMPTPFRLTVVVDGRVTATATVRGFPACRDLAAQAAVDLARRPELVSSPRRVSIRCDVATKGEWA